MSKYAKMIKKFLSSLLGNFLKKDTKSHEKEIQPNRKKYEGIIAIETEDGVKLVDCSRLPKGFLYWLNQ